jgi:hypothetical protein
VLPILGALLAAYATWSLGRGEVHAPDRRWLRSLRRDDRPRAFWSAIAAYFALAAMLLFLS